MQKGAAPPPPNCAPVSVLLRQLLFAQGFFSCRMDNLRASPFFLQYIMEAIPDYLNAVIVAKVAKQGSHLYRLLCPFVRNVSYDDTVFSE